MPVTHLWYHLSLITDMIQEMSGALMTAQPRFTLFILQAEPKSLFLS